MKTVVLLLYIFALQLSVFGQPGDMPHHQEPGKCYAKCRMPAQYEQIAASFPIYTGNSPEEVLFDSVYFSVEPITGDWIYIGHQIDLDLANLDTELTIEKIVYLSDTDKTTDFTYEEISYLKLLHPTGITEWREVLCGDKVDRGIIRALQQALIDKGFLTAVVSDLFSHEVKVALAAFQKTNNLPGGQLDIATLDALGIAY